MRREEDEGGKKEGRKGEIGEGSEERMRRAGQKKKLKKKMAYANEQYDNDRIISM